MIPYRFSAKIVLAYVFYPEKMFIRRSAFRREILANDLVNRQIFFIPVLLNVIDNAGQSHVFTRHYSNGKLKNPTLRKHFPKIKYKLNFDRLISVRSNSLFT